MSSFGGISFAVIGQDSGFPTIERDNDGINRYAATIQLASLSDRNALANLVTKVTVLPLYGRLGGNVHLLGGSGKATLVVPAATGSTVTRDAVLVSLTNIVAAGRLTHRFTAAAEWVLLS